MTEKKGKNELSVVLYWLAAVLVTAICCSAMSFLMPFRIYMIGLLAICMYAWTLLQWKNIVIHPIGVLMLLFTILAVSGVFESLNRRETMKYSMVYLCLLPLIFFQQEDEWIVNILRYMKGTTFFVAITIILNALIPNLFLNYLNFLIRPGLQVWLRAEISNRIFSGIAGEKGDAAFLMVLGIALGLYSVIKDKILTKANALYMAVIMVAMILPAKRVIFAIGCGFFLIYIAGWMKKSKKVIAVTIGIAMMSLVILFADYIPGVNVLLGRFSDVVEDESLNGRSYLWERAIQMFEEKPVFGYGYGSYNTFASYYGVRTSRSGKWSMHAHNTYLQVLGEMGLTGAILFGSVLFIGLVILLRLHRLREQMSDGDKGLLIFTECMFFCYVIDSITSNTIYITNLQSLFIFVLALVIHLNRKYIPKVRMLTRR